MRLMNTTTLELEEYIAPPTPDNGLGSYVILSHRWTNDEITYKDFAKGRRKKSAGYKKIRDFCSIASSDGYHLAWVDTCCIDKTSSAELQESINSMYQWYAKAERCYAHLADVNRPVTHNLFEEQFTNSQWFTRGWTLQELLAPKCVVFYSEDWAVLGCVGLTLPCYPDSPYHDLHEVTSKASGIHVDHLTRWKPGRASVACCMSWAALRVTTREEDKAYCLLGLFDVNMPLLYGEGGTKAFLRLQEAIMKTSDDHTIFAWTATDAVLRKSLSRSSPPTPPVVECHGLLADDPSWFAHAGHLAPSAPRWWSDTDPYSLTSRGMSIQLPLEPVADDIYLATLDCERLTERGKPGSMPAVYLRQLSGDKQIFQRIFCDSLGMVSEVKRPHCKEMLVRQKEQLYVRQQHAEAWVMQAEFLIEALDHGGEGYTMKGATFSEEMDGITTTLPLKPVLLSDFSVPAFKHPYDYATLRTKHIATGEDIFITVAPISGLFAGFDANLAPPDKSARNRGTLQDDIRQWEQSRQRPDIFLACQIHLQQLGSIIELQSVASSGTYHSIQVSATAISVSQHYGLKQYSLYLRLGYHVSQMNGNHTVSPHKTVHECGVFTATVDHAYEDPQFIHSIEEMRI